MAGESGELAEKNERFCIVTASRKMAGMPEPLISLIIVTHNSDHWLTAFFRWWFAVMADARMVHEIVVADSGSGVPPEKICAQLAPAARVIACGNVGYGAAINRAAAITTAPWLLLCNPDISFGEDFFSSFLEPMIRHPPARAGCMAPGLVNGDDTAQPSAGPFPTIRRLITDQFRSPMYRKFSYPEPTGYYDWATGACLLIRREHFVQVGGFDEKFFLYVEEVDLQKRLAGLGLRTWFVREGGVMHHAPNAVRPQRSTQRYSARGMLRYFAKHGALGQLLAYRFLALASFRLLLREAFASKKSILEKSTGP